MMPTNNPLSSSAYLLSALAILHQAAGEIDNLSPENTDADAMRLIARTAIRLVEHGETDIPSVVIYAYDGEHAAFDAASRVSAGEQGGPVEGDSPRPDGLGAHAVRSRQRVLSYEEPSIPPHPVISAAGIQTLACYPLLVEGMPTGVLYIGLHSQRRFTTEELLILDIFVFQAAIAVHNTRRFEEINRALQRKVNELERLRNAERLISSRRNLEETLREILRTAIDVTCAAHGSFRLLDKRANVLRLVALSGLEGAPPAGGETGLPIDERYSVVGWVAQHRQPVRINDLRLPPWSGIYRPLHSKGEMLSELAMPLLGAGGGLEGVLNLESPSSYAFSEDDQHLMEALAVQAVIALQEAKLLEALEEVSNRMINQPLEEILAFIIERACDLINAPHGAVWVLSADPPDTLVVRAATAGHTPGETLPLHGSMIGSSLIDRQPLTSPDVGKDPRFLRRDLARKMGWVSGLVVPLLMRDGTPRGALTLYAVEAREFSEWDKRLLSWLANHTAIAVQEGDTLRELAQARERQTMAETFAALGDVSANLLHRVNNLVGIIPVRVQGLREKRPGLEGDSYADTALTEIEASARAAMTAAREAMAYLRPMKLQPTSVEACYRTARERLTLPDGMELTAAGLETLPPVLAGEEQLRLVLFNLMENALDALAELPAKAGWTPRIRVCGSTAPDPIEGRPLRVEIAVSDNGPGVPAERRDNIFDLSFSTKRSPRKLGFGLWWVKTLITRFGGEIRLTDSPDGGSAFIIHLPCAEEMPT
jgi:GAF domain-containing protein